MTPGYAVQGLRERKKAQTREAIVAAALDLFERQGYDATTVEDIAEAADVSPRTFFRYFDSKVDVVMDHREEKPDDFRERLASRPPEEGPLEATRQVIGAELGQLAADDPNFVRRMRLMLGTPTLQAVAREHFNEHHEEMAADFAARLGVPEGDLRAHVVASAISNTLWTVVTHWVAEGGPPEDLMAMLDEACDLLATGLDVKGERP